MRQDHVLLVADAQFVMAVGFGQIGHDAHLVGGGIARRGAMCLEADRHDGIARGAVRGQIGVGPGAEDRIGFIGGLKDRGAAAWSKDGGAKAVLMSLEQLLGRCR